MFRFAPNQNDFKFIPRLSCRVREQNYMSRKLKRDKKTGIRLVSHLIKLTIKHWFK